MCLQKWLSTMHPCLQTRKWVFVPSPLHLIWIVTVFDWSSAGVAASDFHSKIYSDLEVSAFALAGHTSCKQRGLLSSKHKSPDLGSEASISP